MKVISRHFGTKILVMPEKTPEKKAKRKLTRQEQATRLANKARKQLKTAKKGIDEGDEDVAATFLFQAYENAVRAAAKSTGSFPDTKAHWDLSAQASDLAEEGYLTTNVSDQLDDLNSDRKEAAYGYEEEFEHEDFVAAAEDLEAFLKEVDDLIKRGGKKLKEQDEKQ